MHGITFGPMELEWKEARATGYAAYTIFYPLIQVM
jgi:hypothetical protein